MIDKKNIYTDISDSSEKLAINTIIDRLEDNSFTMLVGFIEVAFVFLIITLVLLHLTMKHLEKLFLNNLKINILH